MPSRPFGITAWAAPYLQDARLVLGTSAAAALRLTELAELADFSVEELLSDDRPMRHGPVGGSPELRELIATRVGAVGADDVAVTGGAGEALFALAWSLADASRHVVVEVPAHQSVFAVLERRRCDVTELVSPVDVDRVLGAIRRDTAAVFLASPHNPTGHVWEAPQLRRIAEELDLVGGVLVVDEAIWGIGIGKPVPPHAASVAPNAVSVGSLSKVHGLPGIRVGWAAGPTLVVDDVRSFHTDVMRSLPVFSERIAVHALRAQDALLARARHMVEHSLPLLTALFDRHPGLVTLPEPDGGTVALARSAGVDVGAWCRELAVEQGVLVAPGDACFGLPGCFSMNLALHSSAWEEAVPILDGALARLALVEGSTSG